jgi:arsenate reductase|tara:strand:- start:37 stop:402 length:366 start_codon:yes stop_codon:yes gene_type:complete
MRILFVCVGNTCRSQMAEGWATHLGLDAASAGTHPGTEVAPNAVAVMAENGIDISGQVSSGLNGIETGDFDRIISMGCGVHCPTLSIDADWALDDPVGQSIDVYRKTRDAIGARVRALLNV